jgi:hypothetical protein
MQLFSVIVSHACMCLSGQRYSLVKYKPHNCWTQVQKVEKQPQAPTRVLPRRESRAVIPPPLTTTAGTTTAATAAAAAAAAGSSTANATTSNRNSGGGGSSSSKQAPDSATDKVTDKAAATREEDEPLEARPIAEGELYMDLREFANAARYLRRALPLHRSDSFSSSISGATATTAGGAAGAGGGSSSVHGSRCVTLQCCYRMLAFVYPQDGVQCDCHSI